MQAPRQLTAEDHRWLLQRARSAGFELAGLAAVPEPESAEARIAERRFTEWLEAGRAGEMQWMARADDAGAPVRSGLRRAMPWARSVLVCAVNYNAAAPLSTEPAEPGKGWIARYAWSGTPAKDASEPARGADYHDVLLPRLRSIEAEMLERWGEDTATRCYVDTGPIVEREYAQRAGIGWIGKNTCLINQETGSWLLMGVIVTSLQLAPEAPAVPAADRCGTCTRCIDACPTDALVAPREMDASRCIAYLTIEKKGTVAEELRAPMGRQVFGCDICQDVCPWNRRAPVGSGFTPRPELVNPALEWLASLDGQGFNRIFRRSPLERTGRKRMLRNVAIAMGNSGDREFLPQLKEWARGEDAVLSEAAEWAAQRLRDAEERGDGAT